MLKIVLLMTFAGLLLFGCSQDDHVVNVYSGRHYQVDEDLFRAFTEKTGIRVNLVKADTDQLLNRLEMEGRNSPADLLITADAGRLVTAAAGGLLQPIGSDYIQETIPVALRDPDSRWVAMTKRARVIVYHQDRVSPEDLSTYESLSEPEWKGRVLVRSSQNHYNQTLMASMIAALGHDEAETWAGRLVQNMARRPRGNDRDQVKAIVAGEGDVAIVNTYYMGLLTYSVNPEERLVAEQTRIFFPNQADRGTHVNYSGIGLTKASPNPENATRLIEFMLSADSQRKLAEQNHEYPVNKEVAWPELLQSWGEFRADERPLYQLGPYLRDAMFIFNRAGWN
ncbi:MAG: Fe(3+) ABC transporter substrate-binding protein [Bacteroidia bacterium]|nr:MAG: Fe(3+) ABC transporter substrate-binding protein [Bacteroidia bacterium]